MKEKDGKEDYDVVGGILSPTLTLEEKTDEEVYKEAFDHFDGNHSKTIPTSVSWKNCLKSIFINIQSLIYGLRRVGLNPTEEEIRDMINQVTSLISSCPPIIMSSCLRFFVSSCLHIIMPSCLRFFMSSCYHVLIYRNVIMSSCCHIFMTSCNFLPSLWSCPKEWPWKSFVKLKPGKRNVCTSCFH